MFLARCAELVAKDAKLDDAKRRDLAKSYGDKSVDLLRQSLDKGYKNTRTWKKHPDLAPLSAREDFQKLMTEVAKLSETREVEIPIAVGAPTRGKLAKGDPLDSFPATDKSFARVHTVTLESGQPYRIDLQGKFDTVLRVEDAKKNPLMVNDDIRPGDLNSRLVFVATRKETYRIIVTSVDPGEVGDYTLAVEKRKWKVSQWFSGPPGQVRQG